LSHRTVLNPLQSSSFLSDSHPGSGLVQPLQMRNVRCSRRDGSSQQPNNPLPNPVSNNAGNHLTQFNRYGVSSIAQLFELTYAAIHSSSFLVVGVADRLGGLDTYLGQVLGLLRLVRLGKNVQLDSRRSSPGLVFGKVWAEEWRIGQALGQNGGRDGSLWPASGVKKPSRKTLILFLLGAVELPYFMTKLNPIQSYKSTGNNKECILPSIPKRQRSPHTVAAPATPGTTQSSTLARTIWRFNATNHIE
jgi:hypothetical protein